ncbi:MAG TPA: universal stress protein [Frankiaceae bacterium]|nr:universal stress protein [Frankiaceae bacterium]
MIVVGVDFSDGSLAAVRWALAEAARSTERVVLLHAGPPTSDLVEHTPLVEGRHAEHRQRLRALAQDVGGAADVADVDGPAAQVLVSEAKDARLLVVGRRGLSALESIVAGSVSHEVLRHARCPVVVVPANAPASPPARVVVGVDDSRNSAVAADWAAVEAVAHGVPLLLVHSATVGLVEDDERSAVTAAEARLAGTVGKDLTIERLVTEEPAGAALVAAAGRDDLLVVGTHARGPIARLFVGSTSTYCVEHAICPVAVVPLHA